MITTGGILSAMTVVALYIASFGIGPNMAFYALCSVFISVMIFEYRIKYDRKFILNKILDTGNINL